MLPADQQSVAARSADQTKRENMSPEQAFFTLSTSRCFALVFAIARPERVLRNDHRPAGPGRWNLRATPGRAPSLTGGRFGFVACSAPVSACQSRSTPSMSKVGRDKST